MTVAMFMVIDPKGNFLISDGSNQEVRICLSTRDVEAYHRTRTFYRVEWSHTR